ncbi:MAG TPA: ABC transporter ATP-binding protein [Baekduia sp.]|nr:ABC transporter ATP-binding protein [Baekduia sp.]
MAQLELDIRVALRSYALGVGLTVDAETVALVGPSGAGKTTVLRAIAGLLRPDAGRVALDGEPWFDGARGVHLAPERRSVGLVFQDYALFPHLTVAQNVAFGGGARTGELLERLRISDLADAKPGTLSGGERQRVALARALARDPAVLLLDEPLAALDAHTRAVVRDELADLLAELTLPAILVTHDPRDATALADRVGVIVDGELRQLGAPQELLDAPADPFVAAFTGANVLHGLAPRAAVAVQPWAVRIVVDEPAGDDGAWVVAGVIEGVDRQGPRARVRLGAVTADMPVGEVAGLERGRNAWATFAAADAHVLPLR